MFARMETDSDDELISSIAPDVMRCLGRCRYFEKLDEHLSPADNSTPTEKCDGSFRLSETILLASGFERDALHDIIAVLKSKGGFCDCEVLYNVAETSRLKANYWRSRAAGEATTTPHAPHSRPN
jgi:hypothetical protein